MLLMKKRLLFSIFCCLFLLGKLETHNFCQRNITLCLSEFLQCQLGAVIHGLYVPPLSQKAGLLGTAPASVTHSPFN